MCRSEKSCSFVESTCLGLLFLGLSDKVIIKCCFLGAITFSCIGSNNRVESEGFGGGGWVELRKKGEKIAPEGGKVRAVPMVLQTNR